MPRKRIRAHEIVKDIMSGMGDASLMEKYNLSPRELLRVMGKLLWKRLLSSVVFAKRKSLIKSVLTDKHRSMVSAQILQDIRSGMGDEELKEKCFDYASRTRDDRGSRVSITVAIAKINCLACIHFGHTTHGILHPLTSD